MSLTFQIYKRQVIVNDIVPVAIRVIRVKWSFIILGLPLLLAGQSQFSIDSFQDWLRGPEPWGVLYFSIPTTLSMSNVQTFTCTFSTN